MADFVDSSITAEIVAAKDKLEQQADRAELILDEWEGTTTLINDAPQDNKLYGRKNGQWDEVNTSGTGDMTKAIYDPQGVDGDAFYRSNHTGTQPISSISGLNTTLNTKIEDAPVDGQEYVRKDGAWEVNAGGDTAITKTEVYESVLSNKGTDLVWAIQANVFVLEVGYYEVSAFGANKGTFPFEGAYQVLVKDEKPTQYFNDGLVVTTNVRSITATMLEKSASEPDTAKGIYYATCYDEGTEQNEAPTWIKVAVGSDVPDVTWGDIKGTLRDQTDLQDALDEKLDSNAYTASDVKTKYESNPDTNAFTDADVSKLGGIEAGAEVNKVNSIVAGDNITIDNDDPLNPVINSTGGGSTPTAADVTVAATPTNYTASAQNVEAHLVGIDTALANAGGGGGASTIPEIDFSVPQEDRVSSWRPDFVSGTNTITPSPSFINKIVEMVPNRGSATDVGSIYFTDPLTSGFSAGESFYLYMNRQFTKDSLAAATFRFNQQDRTIIATDGSGAASLPNLFRVDYAVLFATTATISPSYQWAMLKVTAWSDDDWMVTIDTVIR